LVLGLTTIIGFTLIVFSLFGKYAKSKSYAYTVGMVAMLNAVGYSFKVGSGIGDPVIATISLFGQFGIASLYFSYAVWKLKEASRDVLSAENP
jgi:hypothetical protein